MFDLGEDGKASKMLLNEFSLSKARTRSFQHRMFDGLELEIVVFPLFLDGLF